MSVKFSCGACAARVVAPDAAAGNKGKCPKCKATGQIPTATAWPGQPSHFPGARVAIVSAILVVIGIGIWIWCTPEPESESGLTATIRDGDQATRAMSHFTNTAVLAKNPLFVLGVG